MKDLADIRVLTEAEGTVSVRVDKISSSSSSFFLLFFSPRALERLPCWKGCRGTSAFGWRSTPASHFEDPSQGAFAVPCTGLLGFSRV